MVEEVVVSTPDEQPKAGSTPDSRAGSPRRQRRRERNKAELRDAARECFRDMGYADTTIGQITERADVAHGTFYNYYDTKDEVFSEIVEEMLDELFTVVSDVGDERSIRRRLTFGIGSLFQRCAADRGLVRALLQASHLNQAYSAMWDAFRGRLQQQVRHDLEWLQRRQLAHATDIETMALIITRMIEGVALHIVTDSDADVDAITAGTVEMYWDTIFRPVADGDDLVLDPR